MKRCATVGIILLCFTGAGGAHGKSVTYYTDGALVEYGATASKGLIEVPLLSGLIAGSVRVKPVGGSTIVGVEVLPARKNGEKTEKELTALLEQKERLGDRLRALAIREEIFTSAAKSQSGKAPRKTKTNPDPLQTIRQGTEFAIAQLEAVYTARRKTELEIKKLDGKLAAARKTTRDGDFFTRIKVIPAQGKVELRYAIAPQPWAPRYDIHLNAGESARVQLSGQFQDNYPGYQQRAALAPLSESAGASTVTVQPGGVTTLLSYSLAVTNESFGAGVLAPFTFELKNSERVHLPAGQATIYRKGEYFGTVHFEGISSGRSRKITAGM